MFFVNKILFRAGQQGQVRVLIQRLRSQQQRGKNARNGKLGSSIPLEIDMRRRIGVLAHELNIDPPTFPRQLLDRAIARSPKRLRA